MADLPANPDPRGNAGLEPGRVLPPPTPRWVKVIGIIALVVVVLVGAVQLTGLGGQHGPNRHLPAVGATDPSSSTAGEPAVTDQATRTIEVATLDTMTFAPRSLTVAAGETVTFRVTNNGQAVHDFTLGDAAMQQAHADEMAQMGGAMAADGPNSLTLQPGETKQLTWRFGDAGTLEYACHEAGHYEAGMRGQITIEAAAAQRLGGLD